MQSLCYGHITIFYVICASFQIATNFPLGQRHVHNHFVFVVGEKFVMDQGFSNHQQTLTSDSSHSIFVLFFPRISSNSIENNHSKQKFTGCGEGRLVFCEVFFSKPSALAPTFSPCE